MVNTKRQKVSKIEKLDTTDSYVYDVSMKDQDPFFFANGHLVHNTDSVISSSIIKTNHHDMTIEDLFLSGNEFWKDGNKEYSANSNMQVYNYDPGSSTVGLINYNYVYRHKVSKKLFKIKTADGNDVTVTSDHSVMVVNSDGTLTEKKPTELIVGDKVVTIHQPHNLVESRVTEVSEVIDLGISDDEYVYDIGIDHKENHWFFANNMLVHNSCYFSAWPMIKDAVESGEQEWNEDIAIAFYDSLGDETNKSFPAFMKKAFNCPTHKGELIKCGREVVGSTGLFITKKRYAIMVIDDEGNRKDLDGKPGKLKAMGLDLKRSDTPVVVQDFLKDILQATLTGKDKHEVTQMILDFKQVFKDLPAWEKGAPKRINKLTYYTALEESTKEKFNKSARLPGHVRAGMNYNYLRKLNNDNFTMPLSDGSKAIVCKLRTNALGFTSIARPTDETNIPQWFKDLPFDDNGMSETQIDKKVDNLLGVLKWELDSRTDTTNQFSQLFDF